MAAAPSPDWEEMTDLPLGQFWGPSEVYDAADGYVLFVGAMAHPGQLYTWTESDGTWTNISGPSSASPPGGSFLGMAYDAADQYVVLFDQGTWIFEKGSWTLSTAGTLTPPTDLVGESMAYDPSDGYVLLFGGAFCLSTCPAQASTWSFKGGFWTNLTSSAGAEPGRMFASMSEDVADSEVVLFGGLGPDFDILAGTETFQAGKWSNGPTEEPVGRYFAPMVDDTTDGYVLLYGGYGCSGTTEECADTWTFSSGTWTQWFPAAAPTALGGSIQTMAFDADSGYAVMMDNSNDVPGSIYVWSWPAPLTVDLVAASGSVDVGQTVSVWANVTGGAPPIQLAWGGQPAGCPASTTAYQNCTAVAPGPVTITFQARDGAGRTISGFSTVQVLPDPTLGTPIPSKAEGDVGIAVSFSDPASGGAGGFSYSWSTPAGLGCLVSTGSSITCDPTSTLHYQIGVSATDANGFTVASPNLAFQVSSSPSVSLQENRTVLDLGEAIEFWANATGGSGVYTITYNNLPMGCSSNNVSFLVCVPSVTISATSVTVSVVDTTGGTAASGPVDFTVDSDPVISSAWNSGSEVGASGSNWASHVNWSGTYKVTIVPGTPKYQYCLETTPTTLQDYCSGPISSTSFQWGMFFIPADGMSAGSYLFTINVGDSTGWNTSFTFDLTLTWVPSVGAIQVPVASDENQNVNLSSTVVHGLAPYEYWWNDTTTGAALCAGRSKVIPGPLYCQFSALWTGTDTVNLTLRDGLGASSWSDQFLTVNPDPTVKLSALPRYVTLYSGAVTIFVNGTITGGSPSYAVCLYQDWATGTSHSCGTVSTGTTFSFSATLRQATTFHFNATVNDTAGMQIVASATVTAAIAMSLASPKYTSTDEGLTVTLTATLAGGDGPFSLWINDSTAGGRFLCDASGVVSDGPISCSFRPDWNGTQTLSLLVRDAAGQPPANLNVAVGVQPDPTLFAQATIGPTVTTLAETAPQAESEVGAPIYLNATFSGGTSPWTIAWFAGSIRLFGTTFNGSLYDGTWVPAATGTVNVTVRLIDAVGFEVNRSVIVLVDPGLSDLALKANPGTLDVGVPVNLTLDFIGGTAPYGYRWVIQQPSGPAVIADTKVPWTSGWTWGSPGIYGVESELFDADRISSVAFLNVTVNSDPVIPCAPTTTSTHLDVGAPVNLTLSCATGGTSPLGFVFFFGDRTNSSESSPAATHEYGTANTFEIRVEATDGAGVSVWSPGLNLTIVAPPPLPTKAAASPLGISWVATYALFAVVALLVLLVAFWGVRRSRRRPAPSGPAPQEVNAVSVADLAKVESGALGALRGGEAIEENALVDRVAASTGLDPFAVRVYLSQLSSRGSFERTEGAGGASYRLPPEVVEATEADFQLAAELPSRILEAIGSRGRATPSALEEDLREGGISRADLLVQLINLQKEGRVVLSGPVGPDEEPRYELPNGPKDARPDADDPPTPQLDHAKMEEYLARRDADLSDEGTESREAE